MTCVIKGDFVKGKVKVKSKWEKLNNLEYGNWSSIINIILLVILSISH